MIPVRHKLMRLCAFGAAGAAYCALAAAPEPPAAGPASAPLGAEVFTGGAIPRLRLDLDSAALQSLRREPREFVAGTVTEGTAVFPQVAVHLKGAVGSFRPVDDKPCFTLDFCRFSEGRKFHGLRRIHLNNSVEDPSFSNEKIGSELFQAAGVPAPRVTRALVVLNGKDLGLYVLKEGFTEDFLSRHFRRAGGGLYEPEDGHDVDHRLKRNSVRAPVESRVALKNLAAAAVEPDPARRWENLSAVLDTNRFLAFMAMEIMLGHRDGYCLARNNFRVYHDLDTGKMVFFPQGMDQLLGTADLPWQPSLAGLVAKGVMNAPEGSRRYGAAFRALFTNLFNTATLTCRVDQLTAELRPVLSHGDWSAVKAAADVVKERIVQREASLKAQLARPPRKQIEFEADVASLDGWLPIESPAIGRIDQVNGPGILPSLHILAGSESLASWRTTALVPRGRYWFEGRVRVAGVQPLPSGLHHGAALRVGGSALSRASLTGDSAWKTLAHEFQVEKAAEEVEFICELRARAGEAWFDRDSLKVRRLSSYENR